MKKYDIVIPVSYKDSRFLNKILPWIHENLNDHEKIYILSSKSCYRDFDKSILHSCNACLIDENNLIEGLSFSSIRSLLVGFDRANMTGWYFQQFLKLGFAFSQYAKDYYLIWDSDTVPLQQISFFDGEHILYNYKKEHHQPYFDTITKLLGYTEFMPYSFISEHMMVKTLIMREMVEKVSSSKSWWEDILNKCDLENLQSFSEFETYGTYCVNNLPELYQSRQLMTLRCGGKLFGRQVTKKELKLLGLDFDTASFERGNYPPFPRSILSKLERGWIEFAHKYLNR